MSPFRRSSVFGIVGVLVTMALVVVVALQVDPRDPKPKEELAVIFGIVGTYMVLLFLFQSRDLARAEAADAAALARQPKAIENPATLDEPTLWASMAVSAIDAGAVRARKATWGIARQSMRLVMLVTALIFISVPPIYLVDTFVPLIVGAPLIAGIALWKSARLLAGGGDLDKAYEQVDRSMGPLGLSVEERPEVIITPKSVAPLRMGPTLIGGLELAGTRHGRRVTVRMPADEGVRSKCRVRVERSSPEFEFRSSDGRLKAEDGAPPAVVEALRTVPGSTRWNGLRGSAGDGGVTVEHKGVGSGDWLLDLWLAERVADALG